MQIGSSNVRRIVVTVIVLVVAGLTASAALANSPHFKKGRERSCLMTRSAISKPITCKAVLAGLGLQASVPDNNNGSTLPYDEFGLGPNQPSQPQVGSSGPRAGRAVAEVDAQTSAPDNNNDSTLPYDEFGLGANQPSQPQVGSAGPRAGRAVAEVDAQTSASDNNNDSTLPYDEFGLGTNQPNQPQVGSPGPQTGHR
jgi:hypothetical protein